MSLTKCVTIRMTTIVRSVQLQSKHISMVIPNRQKSKWNWQYSSKEGIPREILTMLTQDYNFSWSSIKAYLENSRRLAVRKDHRFVPERHRALGPDLATAHFLVKRGAKVKFVGRNMWMAQDKQGNMHLPNQFVSGLHLEAIDCTGVQMSYVAFDNMIELEQLRYLNLSRCINVDDWCLARLYQFQDSLEFLDLTGCWEVTHNGLACLHLLKKLKGLKLTGLPNVQDMGLMVLLLEEALPQCTIFGVEEEKLALPSGDSDRPLLSGRLQSITEGGGKEESVDSGSVEKSAGRRGQMKS